MRFSILSLFAVFCFFLPASVSAGEPVACGVPEAASLNTDPGQDYCNLHQRRLAYREEAMKQTQKIEERRMNYHAPQASAVKAYEADIEALNEGRGETVNRTSDGAESPDDGEGDPVLSPE